MSLRPRLALIVGVVAALAIAAACVGAYLVTERQLVGSVDGFLEREARRLTDQPRQDPPRRDDERRGGDPDRRRQPGDPAAIEQLIRRDGQVERLAGDLTLPVTAVDRAVAEDPTADAVLRDVSAEGERLRMITAPLSGGGAVQVARSLAETDDVLATLRTRLIVIGLAGTAAAALLAWLIAVGITGPLRRLTTAAADVARTQQLDTRIDVERRDEVGRLAASFNTMLEALEASREQQRQLVADAGHELRTPLTSLRANAELLQRVDDLPPEDRRRLLDDIAFETDQLSELVNEVVDSAATFERGDLPFDEIELDRLVGDVVERASRRTGRTISLEAAPVAVMGRPEQLERAVGNLLSNAHKFSPPDQPIEVRVDPDGTVAVRDHGPGVPDDEQEQIFQRFHRTDAARTQPGSGLGLAIVRQIAEAHAGTAAARPAPGGGLVVELWLPPIAEAEAD